MRNDAIDYNEVATFIEVVKAGGFSAASRVLGLPKSTISRRVSRLEDGLGVRLLHRTTRRMGLTEAGQAYFERVVSAMRSVDQASEAAREHDGTPRGLLRITAPLDFGHAGLGEIVTRFCAEQPEVTVEVTLGNRITDLVREGFDCALRAGRLPDSTLVARKLAAVDIGLFASPAYIAAHGAPSHPRELARHQLVLFRPQNGVAQWGLTHKDGASVSVEARGPIGADDYLFVRNAVTAGAGIGMLPQFFADEAAERCSGQPEPLVQVLPEWCDQTGGLYLVYPTTRHIPAKVQAFRDFVVRWFADKPGGVGGA